MGTDDDYIRMALTDYATLNLTQLDGGTGVDTLYFRNRSTQGSTELKLTGGGATNFENISGTYGDDFIRGDAGDNFLTGDGSTDTIYGGDGNDLLSGGGVVVNTVGIRISDYDPHWARLSAIDSHYK